jgi:hypothetical protein
MMWAPSRASGRSISRLSLIFVMLALSAVLGSSVRQNAQQRNVLLFKEGKNAIVAHVGGILNRLSDQV